jgi:hypothetical protein
MADQIVSGDSKEADALLLGIANAENKTHTLHGGLTVARYLMSVVILLMLSSCVTHQSDNLPICHGPLPWVQWNCP